MMNNSRIILQLKGLFISKRYNIISDAKKSNTQVDYVLEIKRN